MKADNSVLENSPKFGYHKLPGDLLIEIALHLEYRQDILNLCLTSHHVLSNVSSVLYRVVVLKSSAQCELTLGMLMQRIEIARHVRHLVVRLYTRENMGYATLDNEVSSASVRRIAVTKVLDALVRFDWDSEDLPYFEDMWFALRLGCPQLRHVSTSIGAIIPSLNSHLFDFQNLSGFSLTLKLGFYENIDLTLEGKQSRPIHCSYTVMMQQVDSPAFKNFWEMLIARCPNLEELVLDGTSSVPSDIHFIVNGRWSKLRRLSLGDVCVDWFPVSLISDGKRPFITFLEEHPLLEYLSISRHTIQPHHLRALGPSSLRHLTMFSGTFHQLRAMPHLHHQVKSVTLCDAVESREIPTPVIGTLLRDLISLTELKIAFTLHSMYDSGNLLRSLVQSCPKLRHLELTCGHKPSFQLDSFAKTIREFPRLRSLHLTIVKYPGDETISSGAARIARSNPRLRTFKLTFIPHLFAMPIPWSIPYRAMLFAFACPSKCTGTYELTCDIHGLPSSLHGLEQRLYQWPWGFGTTTCIRKFVQDMGPKSNAHGGKGWTGVGWKAVISLIFERSAAGEEMRMMLLCTFLALLALYANAGTTMERIPGSVEPQGVS